MTTRFGERRATRRAEAANTDVMEGEAKKTRAPAETPTGTKAVKGFKTVEEREDAIAKAEAEAQAKKDAEPVPLTPSPEPPVLPKWQETVAPKLKEKDMTVGDWIVQGVTKIVDEHKLTSLTAWRDPAGNVVVNYVEDARAMYALRKEKVAEEAKA